jgi:HK97 family phage portal protein
MRGLFGTLAGAPRADVSAETILRNLFVRPSKSGENVTEHTALEVSAVLCCARVLMEGVAQVSLEVKKLRKDGGADPAKDHPLYWLLYQQPNKWQTSFRFRETLMAHTALSGNFFAYKNVVRGEIRELIPFLPEWVTVKQNPDWSLTYTVRAHNGQAQEFPQEAIWHVRGPSWNSWMGLRAVHLARESIGLAMASESTQARLHKNSLRSSGVYSVERTLTDDQHKRLTAWIENHLRLEDAFKPLILDSSAKFTPITMNGVDSQHIETRKLQIEEICRHFRVMPIMVGLSDKTATYASAEQMFIAHVVHTLMPWYQRIEQDIEVGLMSQTDRRLYCADFDERELMRGAMKDQAEYYSKALGAGGSPAWLTPNEIRRDVGENPIPGGEDLPKPTNVPAQQPAGNAP